MSKTTSTTATNAVAATQKNTINRIWEYVQAFLAVSLVLATIFCALYAVVADHSSLNKNATQVPETLKSTTFIVLGFYFGRTNHTRSVPTEGE